MITLAHTVTIVHPGTTESRYGDTVDDWSTATEVDEPGWVQQRSTSDERPGRTAVITEWKCFLESTSAVTSRSRLRWEGRLFEVDGDPYVTSTPAGAHHVEVKLRTVDG